MTGLDDSNQGVSRVTPPEEEQNAVASKKKRGKRSGRHGDSMKRPNMDVTSGKPGSRSVSTSDGTGALYHGTDTEDSQPDAQRDVPEGQGVPSGADVDSSDLEHGLDGLPDGNASVRGVAPTGLSSDPVQVPVSGTVSGGGSPGGISGLLHNIKNLFAGGAAAIGSGLKDLGQGMLGGVKAFGTGTAGFFGGVFSKVGHAIGLPASVTGILMLGLLGAGGVAGGMMWMNSNQYELLMRQETIEEDCVEEVEELQNYSPTGDVTGQQLENAKKIWAVGKAIGLTDEQCAGMLGNFMTECELDPSCVEGIYDEPFNPEGPKKKAALEDLCTYFRTSLGPKYGSPAYTDENGHTFGGGGGSPSINVGAYVASKSAGYSGCFAPGIGLAQFTGPESGRLQKYAEGAGMDWWELDLQLAFIIAPVANGGYERSEWLLSDWTSMAGNPEAAASEFNLKFEGNASNFMLAERQANAVLWYNQLKGYSDDGYAQSILTLAETVLASGAGNAAAEAEDECAEAERQYDNSDAARAAVAYAWKTTDLGRGNNGTELYQLVHDAIMPGDPYYMSCDRGVATAVRWSGTDDSFPMGDTDVIDAYLQSSPKWEDLGEFDGDITKLQPGDILNTTRARRGTEHGHIVIYVSNEIVREKFPDSDACLVSASYMERSPGCETYSGQFVGEGYHVYRCIQKETNSQYVNVAEGFHGDDGS